MEKIMESICTMAGGLLYVPLWFLIFILMERLLLRCYSYKEIRERKILNDNTIGLASYSLLLIITIVLIMWLPSEIKKLNEEKIVMLVSSFIISIIFYVMFFLKGNFSRKKILIKNEILMDNRYALIKDTKIEFSDLLGSYLDDDEKLYIGESEYERFTNEFIGFKYEKYYLTKANKDEYIRTYLFFKQSDALIQKKYRELKKIKIKRELDDAIYLEMARNIVFDSLNSYDYFCVYFLNRVTAYNIYIIDKDSFMYNLISAYTLLVKSKILSKKDIDVLLIDLYLENADKLSFKDSIALLKHFKFNIDIKKMKNDYQNDKSSYIETIKYNLKKQIEK